MAFQCNIDARGKRVRLLMGLFALAAAVLITLFWAVPSGLPAAWVVAAVLFATAAFTLFESRAGWCAFRAMGFKTRF